MRPTLVHLLSALCLLSLMVWAFPKQAFAGTDMVQCTESDKRIVCNLSMPEFIEHVRPILTNGWENTIQINITLLNGNGNKTIKQSRLEATQRCYLDPFESPCLILWRGAPNWLRYRDEAAFLKAFSHIGIQAMTLTELPADNSIIRINIQVMASAQKRLEAIKSWFKTGSSDADNNSWSTNSLIGSFLSSRAENLRSQSYDTTLETAQFYIDLDFEAPAHPEADKESTSEEITEDVDESEDSAENE